MNKTTRLSLDLTPGDKSWLDELEKSSSAASKAEVIRRALGVYRTLFYQQENGGTLIFRAVDGTESKILFI